MGSSPRGSNRHPELASELLAGGGPPTAVMDELPPVAEVYASDLEFDKPATTAAIRAEVTRGSDRSDIAVIGFGRNLGPSTAGAIAHMQFIPRTWAAYGVDANKDGATDPNDVADAISGAANYLRASGAPGDWHKALFAYNHADWYVRRILDGAEGFAGRCERAVESPHRARRASRRHSLDRVIPIASWVHQGRHPYCWGGGHSTAPGAPTESYCWTSADTKAFATNETGLDCSGTVRWLLTLTGYDNPGGITSGSYDDIYPSGPGRAETIWSSAARVFIEVHGKGFWAPPRPPPQWGRGGWPRILRSGSS